MRFDILTLFPELLQPIMNGSILGRAVKNGLIDITMTNPRDYTLDKHRSTDDYPFGGGAGMLMTAQPIVDAIEAVDPNHEAYRIYMSPRGRTFNQRIAEDFSKKKRILLLCGHYEGVDQRALDLCIDEEMSVGDYVLTGGELGAAIIVDATARLCPGVLGCDASGEDESFSTGLLEYPQYTRPAEFRGMPVPDVLLGGKHADIEAWRREQSLRLTAERRPDLLSTAPLTDKDKQILAYAEREKQCLETYPDGEGTTFAESEDFPKRWLKTFVADEVRKAARKACTDGRHHKGGLKRAFEGGFVESKPIEMPEVWQGCLYLEKEKVLLKGNFATADLSDCVLVDHEFTRTVVISGGHICYTEI